MYVHVCMYVLTVIPLCETISITAIIVGGDFRMGRLPRPGLQAERIPLGPRFHSGQHHRLHPSVCGELRRAAVFAAADKYLQAIYKVRCQEVVVVAATYPQIKKVRTSQ